MVRRDDDFFRKLLATFKLEAEEHIRAMSAGLLELEQAATPEGRAEIVETVFREAHSLKGAARSVNQREIEKICQAQESVFAAFKRGALAPSPELLDNLHQTVDLLGHLLSTLESQRASADKKRITELIRELQRGLETQADAPAAVGRSVMPHSWEGDVAHEEGLQEVEERPVGSQAPEDKGATLSTALIREEKPARSQTVRISTTKLDTLLLQSEELLSSKLTARQRVAELREVGDALEAWERGWARIQPDLRAVLQGTDGRGSPDGRGEAGSRVKRILDFLAWNSTTLKSLGAGLAALVKASEQDQRTLGGLVDHLLEDMKKVLMLPASSLLEIAPRLVRDLSRDRGKEVELVMRGGEIEVDRRILEEIKNPLIHLIRNAIDHGIEKPEERTRKHKPARGTVTLSLRQQDGSEVELTISDDGAGIDVAKVRSAAVRSGAASPAEAEKLVDEAALRLVLRSGISTSPIITDISGRGLGLAIVQEKVEKLGGTLSLESRPDEGATFRIRLPLTLATFRGILVRAGEHLFIFPTANIRRVVKVNREDVKTVERRETIRLDDQLVVLARLIDMLGMPVRGAGGNSAGSHPEVLVVPAERGIGFLVDEILDEREVLVKGLGPQLTRVRNIAGATVLGTGQVVPILNVSDLLDSAMRATASPTAAAAAEEEGGEARRASILIAEDSITARTLLQNILEAAGYEVKTTVDGAAALTELKAGNYDLLVSDVEMPRMSGFELTAKVREDKRLAELPVVLVTSLDSREDRERGIDVGANAYIVKSSFDQSNLLEAIRRLT